MPPSNPDNPAPPNKTPPDVLSALQDMAANRTPPAPSPLKKPPPPSAIPNEILPEATTPIDSPRISPTARPFPVSTPNANTDSNEILSASGFVSMLAKNANSASHAPAEFSDLPGSARADMPDAARPQPRAIAPGDPRAPRAPRRTDQILEAREIQMRPTPAPLPAPRLPTVAVPNWYSVMIPIFFTLASLLMIVGLWAILGSIALSTKLQGVPLVQLPEEGQDPQFWDYMPYIMLLCLPVSVSLAAMAIFMQKQINAARRRTTST